MDAEVIPYEPLPRWGHVSVPLGNKVYMWGGRTEDFSETQRKKLASTVEVFNCKTETWVTRNTSGTAPLGLYNSAYAIHGSILYVYGGWDGQKAHNTLHQLNLKTFVWSEVKVENPDKSPSEMSGCGLVAYGNKLVLFGGYGMMKDNEEKGKVDEKDGLTSAEGETTEKVEKAQESGDTSKNEGTKESESRTPEPSVNGVKEDDWVRETLALVTIEDVTGEGVGEGGPEKDAEEKKGVEGKENAGIESLQNGGQVEENATQEVSSMINETTVEVTESVNEKNKKAVVIKLPVSYELDEEKGDKAVVATDKQDTAAVKVTGQKELNDEVVSVPTLDAGEVNAKDEQREEDEKEMNTTFSIYKRNESDQKGWTNEVKVFDLDTGMWSSQPTSGTIPPPSVDFSFTCVDKTRAVVFGGYQPETGITNDTFLLDMDTWVWTKLSGLPERPPSPSQPTPSLLLHPSARDGHSACVIEGSPQPLMLVTGGWDAADHALDDMWLLDIKTGLWSQMTEGGEVGGRFWHTTVASQFSSRMRQVLTFGGCPGAPESHTTGSWPKMANTVLVEIGKMSSVKLTSDAGNEEKWVVVDSVPQDKLGDPMRRLRETVLLTSVRAQRAEELIQGLAKKIERMSVLQVSAPKPEVQKSLPKQVVTEEKEEEEKKPFWQKSINEIQMTYEEIGRGRFSVVKVAIYHETHVAVRCLFTRIASEENRKILVDCLKKAAQVRHPNLVSFMGAVLEREPVIITELMPCNLRSLLEKNPLTYYQLVDVALGVSKGLEYLHSVKPEPVVHGELTGTSVLLEGDKGPRLKAKLSDYITAKYFHRVMSSMTPAESMEDVFGSSKEHPSQEYKSRRRSRSHSGSPFDMSRPRVSPERSVRPSTQLSRKVTSVTNAPHDAGMFSTKRDVYLFGILLVEMATRTAVLEVSLQYLIESIAWPQVTALVKKCLTHDPDLRPDMKSVLSEVMQLASSKP